MASVLCDIIIVVNSGMLGDVEIPDALKNVPVEYRIYHTPPNITVESLIHTSSNKRLGDEIEFLLETGCVQGSHKIRLELRYTVGGTAPCVVSKQLPDYEVQLYASPR